MHFENLEKPYWAWIMTLKNNELTMTFIETQISTLEKEGIIQNLLARRQFKKPEEQYW